MSHMSHAVYGPVSAAAPQPCRRERVEDGRLLLPWRSRRLPSTLLADNGRRTTFRTLLRHSEGVPVELPDGGTGIVADVVLPALGFDFWPEELIVATANGRLRMPVGRVARIDVRTPRIVIG